MAWFIECPFCHKSVFRWFYSWHESKHTTRRADGQMEEHITLAPDQRFEGSLDGVPKAYRHARCGVVTGMPEEIIRTYLVNPLTYNDSSFCCGCGDYVISSELTWVETGESVMGYTGKMRCEYIGKTYNVDPLAAEIFVTPGAIEAVRKIVAQFSLGEPYYLLVEMIQLEMNVNYKVDILTTYDASKDDVIDVGGMKVVVAKSQRKRLKGTMVHHTSIGGQPGFSISRLCSWS